MLIILITPPLSAKYCAVSVVHFRLHSSSVTAPEKGSSAQDTVGAFRKIMWINIIFCCSRLRRMLAKLLSPLSLSFLFRNRAHSQSGAHISMHTPLGNEHATAKNCSYTLHQYACSLSFLLSAINIKIIDFFVWRIFLNYKILLKILRDGIRLVYLKKINSSKIYLFVTLRFKNLIFCFLAIVLNYYLV